MIYGYSEKVADDEYGLLQMREISFSMTSAQLRIVGQFLAHMADDIDAGKAFLHRHIAETSPDWKASGAEVDIVVLFPNQPFLDDIDKG